MRNAFQQENINKPSICIGIHGLQEALKLDNFEKSSTPILKCKTVAMFSVNPLRSTAF